MNSKLKKNRENMEKELKLKEREYKLNSNNMRNIYLNELKRRKKLYLNNIIEIKNKFRMMNKYNNIIYKNKIEYLDIKYLNIIKSFDFYNKIDNMKNLKSLNSIIYNTYKLYNNNYFNLVNFNNILLNYYKSIKKQNNNEYDDIIKIKNGKEKMNNITDDYKNYKVKIGKIILVNKLIYKYKLNKIKKENNLLREKYDEINNENKEYENNEGAQIDKREEKGVYENINKYEKEFKKEIFERKLSSEELNFNNINKNEDKINILNNKNEIICYYNKQEDEINLLHDYNKDTRDWNDEGKKSYIEGKNNINGKFIDIYINDKKIEFIYKYKSNERGLIKVKFIFNELLNSTYYMFFECYSLNSIDLSSFNSSNVKDFGGMFGKCTSLNSIDLTSFNTVNAKYMGGMYYGCSSLNSLDLSSFNTINVNRMKNMFYGCSSLKSIILTSFITTNLENMSSMFYGCSSLNSLDLSSFDTTNVKDTCNMFKGCCSLMKGNVRINGLCKKILKELEILK